MARALSRGEANRLFEKHPEIEELAVIRTCHRVELFVLDRDDDPMVWRPELPGALEGWRTAFNEEAVHHLHRVVAGLESLASGEREVREQISRAISTIRSRHPRPVLAEAIRVAVAAAGELDTPLSTRRSVAAIASARVLDETGRPFPRVVVIGTGAVGRQVAEALGPYARVTLTYRTTPPPDALLRVTGCRAAPLKDLVEEVRHADAVVAAVKSGERILGVEELAGREEPLVIIDLGLPRNIDPAVGALSFVRLVDLEELYAHAQPNASVSELDGPVRAAAHANWIRIEPWLTQPWVDRLMRDAEALRQAELGRAQRHLGPLTLDQQEAVDRLTRRLTEKLMRFPLQRVRTLPSDPEHDAERGDTIRLWVGKSSSRP